MSASHTETLAELKRQLAEEATAARTLDAEADSAAADLAQARDAVVTAYADNDATGIKKATAARDKAEARITELADRQDAARIRVERGQHAAQAYEAEHARDLIAELEPDAGEAVEALQRHAAELVAADRRWHNVSAEVSRLVAPCNGLRCPVTEPLYAHHNIKGSYEAVDGVALCNRHHREVDPHAR
jgi:chromosome segregation ATPase